MSVMVQELELRRREVRNLMTRVLGKSSHAHIGGCLSILEVVTVLYFHEMKVDPRNPRWDGRDYLVLSKGHAGPVLYSALAVKGFFDPRELFTLNEGGTRYPSHVDRNRTPGIDMTCGSLGQGLSVAAGMAIGLRFDRKPNTVYCIVSDGECQEGQVWEAAMFSAHQKLDNMVVFCDSNKAQTDGFTKDINNVEPLPDKWRAFGWEVFDIDGHDMEAIIVAVAAARKVTGRPRMIILNTVKGNSAPAFHGTGNCHCVDFTPREAEELIAYWEAREAHDA
jgi:transketolase